MKNEKIKAAQMEWNNLRLQKYSSRTQQKRQSSPSIQHLKGNKLFATDLSTFIPQSNYSISEPLGKLSLIYLGDTTTTWRDSRTQLETALYRLVSSGSDHFNIYKYWQTFIDSSLSKRNQWIFWWKNSFTYNMSPITFGCIIGHGLPMWTWQIIEP